MTDGRYIYICSLPRLRHMIPSRGLLKHRKYPTTNNPTTPKPIAFSSPSGSQSRCDSAGECRGDPGQQFPKAAIQLRAGLSLIPLYIELVGRDRRSLKWTSLGGAGGVRFVGVGVMTGTGMTNGVTPCIITISSYLIASHLIIVVDPGS